jgi:hypothetical protein
VYVWGSSDVCTVGRGSIAENCSRRRTRPCAIAPGVPTAPSRRSSSSGRIWRRLARALGRARGLARRRCDRGRSRAEWLRNVCAFSGKIKAIDVLIEGTSTTVADLIGEVASLRQEMAAVKAFVGMMPPPSHPPPPALPPPPNWQLAIRSTGSSNTFIYSAPLWSGGAAASPFGDETDPLSDVLGEAFTGVAVRAIRVSLNGITKEYDLPEDIAGLYSIQQLANARAELPSLIENSPHYQTSPREYFVAGVQLSDLAGAANVFSLPGETSTANLQPCMIGFDVFRKSAASPKARLGIILDDLSNCAYPATAHGFGVYDLGGGHVSSGSSYIGAGNAYASGGSVYVAGEAI